MQNNAAVDNLEMSKLQLALDKLLTEEAAGISITPSLGAGNQAWQITLDKGIKAIYRLNERVEEVQFIVSGMEGRNSETSVTSFLRTKKSKEDIYEECLRAYMTAVILHENELDARSIDVDLSDLENNVNAIILTKKSCSNTTLNQQCLAIDLVKYPPDKPFNIDELVTPDESFEILEDSSCNVEIDVDTRNYKGLDGSKVDDVLSGSELVEIIDEIDKETGMRWRNLVNEEFSNFNVHIAACLAGNIEALREMGDYDHFFIVTPDYVFDTGPKGILMRYADTINNQLNNTDDNALLDILYKIVDFDKIPIDERYEMEQRFESGIVKMGSNFLKMMQFLDDNEGDIIVYSESIRPAHIVDRIFPMNGQICVYSTDVKMMRGIASCIMKSDKDNEVSMRGIDYESCSLDSGDLKTRFIGHFSRDAFKQYVDGVQSQFDALSKNILEGKNYGSSTPVAQEVITFEELNLSVYDEFGSVPTIPDINKAAGIAPCDNNKTRSSLCLVCAGDDTKFNGGRK